MTGIPYTEELNELTEKALAKLMPNATGILTKGLVILEVLAEGEDDRGVVMLQLGRQGAMQPWEMVGLLTVAETQAKMLIAHGLHDGWHDDDDV